MLKNVKKPKNHGFFVDSFMTIAVQVFEITRIVYSSLINFYFFQIIGMGGFLILEYFKELKSTII
jgi:hypothetical protein